MALLFFDGFDDRNTFNGLKGWSGGGDWTAGVGVDGTDAIETANNETLNRSSPSTDPTVIIGFAYNPYAGATTGGNDEWLSLAGDGGTTTHIVLSVSSSGDVAIRRAAVGGTILAQTAIDQFQTDTYAYWELKVLINDTTGTVELKKNGVTVASATGVDTKNGGTNSYIDEIELRGMADMGGYWDDFYLADTTGSDNTDFLGEVHVDTLFPDADGSPSEWVPSTGTDHYALVDENPPNTTDYNSSETPGDIDMYSLDAMTDTTHVVYGVQVETYAAKDDAGARTFRSRVDSDSNIETGTTQSPSTSYAFFLDLFETDPDGGGAWTPAQINAAEFGVELVA